LRQGHSSRALVKLVTRCLRQLFHTPLVLIYVIAERYLGVDIISIKENVSLIKFILDKRWKFEKGLFNGTIVIYMNSIFEHVVEEIWVWFNEII
jgi:hypothetical protein